MSAVDSRNSRLRNAIYGIFIGDALAMPVHWYYDTAALKRDYGLIVEYVQPRNPHPDSILWRSSYVPPNKSGNILHKQIQYWGQKDIHYHQFLEAGENTLNLKLAGLLLEMLERNRAYSEELWLQEMISYLLDPQSHNDTYIEEYLRHFFYQYARGIDPRKCGRQDENHIGGFSLMLPLLVTFYKTPEYARSKALDHLLLTHGGRKMKVWGSVVASIVLAVLNETPLSEAIEVSLRESALSYTLDSFTTLFEYPDDTVVRRHFSSACYVDFAVPATLYLALKYQNDPQQALIANTMCGGDNCGRGAVLGALLGGIAGNEWPSRWIDDLRYQPPIVHLNAR